MQISNTATLELSRWKTKKCSGIWASASVHLDSFWPCTRQEVKRRRGKPSRQCESGADGLAPASTVTSFPMVSFSSGYISIFPIKARIFRFLAVLYWRVYLTFNYDCSYLWSPRTRFFFFFHDIMGQPIADALLPHPHLSIISASYQMHLQKLHVAAWLNLSASRSRADALSDILINQLQQAAASFSSPTPLLCF